MANRFKTESEPKSPPSKQRRLTYEEKRLSYVKQMRKKCFVRQRASPEGETKEQRLVCLSYLTILEKFFKYILVKEVLYK